MTSDAEVRPAPLVPEYVDLTDFPDMPLGVQRLRDSSLASDEPPDVCWAALLLWAAAWHQIPAASVPNSAGWLAERCGYRARGRIDPAWNDVSERVLRGFVLCDDGRLYHRVLAQKALEAWASKVRHRHERMCDRVRKTNKARIENGLAAIVPPNLSEWVISGMLEPESERNSGGIPADGRRKSGLKGREGKGSKEKAPTSSSLPPRAGAHTHARTHTREDAGDQAEKRAKPSRQCPASWQPDDGLRAFAREKAPLVSFDDEIATMRDHTFARAPVDWTATARNWLRRAQKDAAAAKARTGGRGNGGTPAFIEQQSRRIAAMTGGMFGVRSDDPGPSDPDTIDMEFSNDRTRLGHG